MGKVIRNFRISLSTEVFEIDISNLPNGIYYLQDINDENESIKKVVKI